MSMNYTNTLMTHHSPWNTTFGALIVVSACAAASAALVGNLAARVLLVQEGTTPSESPAQPENTGPDEKWRKDLLRSLDDQLRNMKDLERNANQSKDTALLSEIQTFRSSVDGHKSCIQSASTQEALQACNDAMQSMWDASSKLWTRSDIANRERELKDMERQIKDAEREKTDVSKAKSILEQLRTALGNVRSLLQSGADNRDVQDAMQDTVQPLQQEFYNVINVGRRQGEAARFRNEQLKNMERQIKEVERDKGDVTRLRDIVKQVEAALATAEQLVQSGADSSDVDDAFRTMYDLQNAFSAAQTMSHNVNAAARFRKDQLKSMERDLKEAKKNATDTSQLEAIVADIKAALDRTDQMVQSNADPQEINDLFQDGVYGKEREFWDLMSETRTVDLQHWTKKGGELDTMAREIKRLKKDKMDTSELENIVNQMKGFLEEAGRLRGEEQQDVMQNVYDLQQGFWPLSNALNMRRELDQWTRKGGHLAKMQKIVDTLRKKGKDTSAAESTLQEIRATVANLEQSTDQDALEEGRLTLDDLRRQFEEAIRPFMKKKSKGFPFPMKKG